MRPHPRARTHALTQAVRPVERGAGRDGRTGCGGRGCRRSHTLTHAACPVERGAGGGGGGGGAHPPVGSAFRTGGPAGCFHWGASRLTWSRGVGLILPMEAGAAFPRRFSCPSKAALPVGWARLWRRVAGGRVSGARGVLVWGAAPPTHTPSSGGRGACGGGSPLFWATPLPPQILRGTHPLEGCTPHPPNRKPWISKPSTLNPPVLF